MNETFEKAAEQVSAFQKLWTETFAKALLATANGAGSPPPEMLRQIRSGIFQTLAGAWEEFMRSPQFLESMKQWMESAVSFRRITNDFMARVRNETQSPSRDDIDSVMLTVRHIEKRLLDRLDELSAKLDRLHNTETRKPDSRAKAAARTRNPRRHARRKTTI